MSRRKLRLPVLTVRTLLLVCGALVVVCVGVGLAMRASLTDYAHDGAAVEQLPFVVNSRASTDALSLHTREEIAAAADEAALPAEVDAAYTLGMASEEVLDEAPIVLTGTFTGERTYVYQAFQCQIEVTSVLKGRGRLRRRWPRRLRCVQDHGASKRPGDGSVQRRARGVEGRRGPKPVRPHAAARGAGVPVLP